MRSWHDFHEIEFDLFRIVFLGQTDQIGQSLDMRINDDPRNPKGLSQNEVGCFSADSWKGYQRLELGWDLSVETSRKLRAEAFDGFGLVSKKPGGTDVLLKLAQFGASIILGGSVFLKEAFSSPFRQCIELIKPLPQGARGDL